MTVHVPRRPYVEALPGIPTIRPFEALSCGIPLISAPWNDAENLFNPNRDFLFVNNKQEMKEAMQRILTDGALVQEQTRNGLDTILQKHTCAHRVDELYEICSELGVNNLHHQTLSL
jgi:spore maturation protein CgeB